MAKAKKAARKKRRDFRKVTRSAYYSGIRHASGGPLHYAHGFDELAAAIGAPREDIVAAVHSGLLNPLHLRQVVAAQVSGLEWATNPPPKARAAMGQAPEQVWSDQKCVAWRIGRAEPPKGSSDVWCLCSDDLALAAGCSADMVRAATKSARADMVRHDFTSVVDWVRGKLPPAVLADLTGRPASATVGRAYGSVLDADKVRALRSEYDGGATLADLAAKYHVSSGSIRKAVTRRTWRRVA